MGSVQQIRVKWNHHQSNFPKVFDNLLHKKEFVDVTLACEGQSLKAHKMVLSACSPYFHSLFVENPCQHPIVLMRDFKYIEIEAIIEYMYKGEVNISRDSLRDFLKTAQSLQVKGLADDNGETDNVNNEESTFTQDQLEQVPELPPARIPRASVESSIQRDQYSQPTPNKRMRLEKPARSVPPSPSHSVDNVSLPLSTTVSSHSIPETVQQSSTSHTKADIVSDAQIKFEVKPESIQDPEFRYDDTVDSNTMEESQDLDQAVDSPEHESIILGDDPEIIEDEPEIMYSHSNSSQEGRLSQTDNLTTNLLNALSSAGPSMPSPQPPGEDDINIEEFLLQSFQEENKDKRSNKRSKVWSYFTETPEDRNKALCHLCGEVFVRGGRSTLGTANLKKHMKRLHPEEYSEMMSAPNLDDD